MSRVRTHINIFDNNFNNLELRNQNYSYIYKNLRFKNYSQKSLFEKFIIIY
jgi:hypothetical protein